MEFRKRGRATRKVGCVEGFRLKTLVDLGDRVNQVKCARKPPGRKTMKTTMTAITLVLALIGPATIGPAMAADDAMSIAQQLNQTWVAASDKGDAAGFSALYAKDGGVLPHGSADLITGEANLRKFFDEIVKGPRPVNFKVTVSEAKMLDPKTMFADGTYALDFPGQNGAASTHVTGTYLSIDVLDGSNWKIRTNTWNQMPPPSAQPATAAAPSATTSGSSTPKN
jgi:uncharacterized protein (TIGR02246 family)